MERTTNDRVDDPVIGRLLDGRYRVGPRIARGGMATVYEATDTRLDRPVALKVMHPGHGDDESFSRRFRREAQAAARLAHQNVVAVFDQGDDDGVLFLVMERVSGITLRDLIRAEAPIPPIKALAVIEPVLAALASAHHAGMIHRDVKPENVLLSDDGRVKVADFGLARAINAETSHTGTGVLIGTVSYLAPELVVAGEADARADVYAAGVLIYEMLTGSKPHQAETAIQIAYKHVHDDIAPPSRLAPGLPAYVDALVARATARDVKLRPVDAGVLLNLVRRVRATLEDGVVDDPDLVADLLPATMRRDPFQDTDDQMPRVIIDPSSGGVARDDSRYDARDDDGPDTGAWSPVGDLDGRGYAYADGTAGNRGGDGAWDDRDERTTSLAGGRHASAPFEDPVPFAALGAHAEPTYDPYARDDLEPSAAVWSDDGLDDRYAYDAEPGVDHEPVHALAEPGARRRSTVRRRRVAVLLAIALVTALVVGLGAWYFGVGRYTVTPAVINLKQSVAEGRVEKAGLKFSIERSAYSERIAAGAVLSTDPEPGSKILRSGSVGAVISRGPERHGVPNVKGNTLDAAQAALQDARLTFGKAIGQYDERVPKGQVLSTSPKIGTELRRNAAVDVVVSKGRKPIQVPDLGGDPYAGAVSRLKGLGLSVSTSQTYSDKVARGNVLTQTPNSGTRYRGDKVTLVISRGPQLVTVPKVRALSVKEARAALEAKGFKVKTKQSKQYTGLRYVLSSNPREGQQAPKGSTVTLSLV